ncbi:hypothetical protein [Halomonas flagellata]|uniref:hypothetical protein n=1 Tax=Halomonas flagellata TaxID=2920385 RepID=UPI0030B83181
MAQLTPPPGAARGRGVALPAGLAVNLVLWNRDAELVRLALGGAIILASLALNEWWLRRRSPATA